MSKRFARALREFLYGFFGGRMIPVKVSARGGRRGGSRPTGGLWMLGGLAVLAGLTSAAVAAPPETPALSPAAPARTGAPLAPAARAELDRIVARGVDYLRRKGQAADGSFSGQAGPAVTALCVAALLGSGVPASDPAVARGLAHLETFVREDGGIYAEGSSHVNYETALAVVCLTKANAGGPYDQVLAKADAFLKGLQWDETEGKDATDPTYGGAGYGRSKRPDLSNTSFFLDALQEARTPDDDEAIKRALVFVSRCQNLESEHNTTEFAARVGDGGFYYTPAAGGSSQAGTTDDGGLRSYASMTYAGLKSMIYAGVDRSDPRVKAATAWLAKHYDLESNPGMGQAGLYYYYHTVAKALSAVGEPTFADAGGVAHDWRAELIRALAARQREDGSWVNPMERWMEGDANLVTGYALLALAEVADAAE